MRMEGNRGRIGLLSSALLLSAIAVSTLLATRHEALRLSSFEANATSVVHRHRHNATAVDGTLYLDDDDSPDTDDLPSQEEESDDGGDGSAGEDESNDELETQEEDSDDDGDSSVEEDESTDELEIGRGEERDSAKPSAAAARAADRRTPHVVDMLSRSAEFDASRQRSPACHPHFDLASSSGGWSANGTRFKRIYFYHARKAGGSSVNRYLEKVASHHGVELKYTEWSEMEEPGTHDEDSPTFYVTHLREPVDRSISHFKYQGRWDCRDLVRWHGSGRGKKRGQEKAGNDTSWAPTAENANSIETWNRTGGHRDLACKRKYDPAIGGRRPYFFMGNCAVNCYAQWFSGASCPSWGVSAGEQLRVALSKVYRYNMVIVIEKLRDPSYVRAVEEFFGVGGLLERGQPYCERDSHRANGMFPLEVKDETRERLRRLNGVDIELYDQLTKCLDDRTTYDFPKWDGERFALNWFNSTKAKEEMKKAKAAKLQDGVQD